MTLQVILSSGKTKADACGLRFNEIKCPSLWKTFFPCRHAAKLSPEAEVLALMSQRIALDILGPDPHGDTMKPQKSCDLWWSSK